MGNSWSPFNLLFDLYKIPTGIISVAKSSSNLSLQNTKQKENKKNIGKYE